ncbi:MAG: metallophosphoesterase family protein [Chthoniobacteraceae bacterium]
MRIAVISDTHNRLPAHVAEAIRGAGEIWHLGDVTDEGMVATLAGLAPCVRAVRGNCDACLDWPVIETFEMNGLRIHLEHIPPRVPPPGIDLLLHGHTHVPRDEVIAGTRFLNPGTVGNPNKGAPASYAWLTFGADRRLVWEIVRV